MTQKRWLTTIVVLLCLAALAAASFIYSGVYDVAASEPHSAVSQWVLHTTMRRSVSARAKSVDAPAQFSQDQVRAGGSEFREMCVDCHGAPGQERGEVGKGLNPSPPDLAEAGSSWSSAEIFWILKNGIKMTGMPAFGPTHSDDVLWSIVAFVKQKLPQLTPEDFKSLGSGERSPTPAGDHAHGHDHNDHDHGH